MGIYYIVGCLICLAVAVAGGLALRWATRMSSRVEQLEAENGNRSPVFLGVDQEQFDALKKVVGANETTLGGNIKLLLGDRDELAKKVAKLEQGLVSVANEVADMTAEKTVVGAKSSPEPRARDLPFAT